MKKQGWKRIRLCKNMAEARRVEKKLGKDKYGVAEIKVRGQKKNPIGVYRL